MKKLLLLILVLGMASAANAAIILSFDDNTTLTETDLSVGDTAVIGIYATDIYDYGAYLSFGLVSEGGFFVSNPRYLYPGPPIIIPPFPPEPIDDHYVFEVFLAFTQAPGIQVEVDLTCLKAGVDVFVELYDAGTFALVDSLIIHQVPEPVTLALLGLGGLFLTRRRR
jgi:hypothetical protein